MTENENVMPTLTGVVPPAPSQCEPERYTLDEAREILNQESCAHDGHDFAQIINGAGDPISLICERCNRSWACQEA